MVAHLIEVVVVVEGVVVVVAHLIEVVVVEVDSGVTIAG